VTPVPCQENSGLRLGTAVANFLGYVAACVAGAMIVLALKVLFQTAR
jgi:hypothetical protein